jgi:hypothetical protein
LYAIGAPNDDLSSLQSERALELEAQQKNRIIQQLEEEKRKIEADVLSLKVERERRQR